MKFYAEADWSFLHFLVSLMGMGTGIWSLSEPQPQPESEPEPKPEAEPESSAYGTCGSQFWAHDQNNIGSKSLAANIFRGELI